MKSKRLSHTLKVMRLGSDLEVRARLQTQECLAQKPGSMFSLLLLCSPRRRAHSWKCPYRVSFKALTSPFLLIAQFPVSSAENLTGSAQVNCALWTNPP